MKEEDKLLIHIREARPGDNEQLQHIMVRCIQGTSLRITLLNTPDFFVRAKAFAHHKVFVAEDGAKLLGSSACAVQQVLINGILQSVGYEFQLFVDPAYRKQAIARQLKQPINDYFAAQKIHYSYAFIVPGNLPPIRFIESRGSYLYRKMLNSFILVHKIMPITPRYTIRPATHQDLDALAQLLNESWGTANFYTPLTAETLLAYIERVAGLELKQVLLLEEHGKLLASVGIWDWCRIMQITIQTYSRSFHLMAGTLDVLRVFRPMPRLPKVGEAFRQWGLTLLAFREVDHLAVLLREVNNRAFRAGIEQIIVAVCDRDHRLLQALKGFIAIKSPVLLYVRNYQASPPLEPRPIFVDAINF